MDVKLSLKFFYDHNYFLRLVAVTSILLMIAPWPSTGSNLHIGLSDSYNLQATYKDNVSGIVISASRYKVEVKSLNGELLASSQYLPDGQVQLTEILESCFIRLNISKFDYLIPKSHFQKAKEMVGLGYNAAFMDLVVSQSQKYAAHQLRNVITQLVSRRENKLFLESSIELAKQGITGMTHPHVLPFFMFVEHLQETAKALKLYEHQSQSSTAADATRPIASSASTIGSNSTSSDDCLDDCPPCVDEECLGLCGYGCNCWSFICGDCCYHLGCYEHDLCCRQNFFNTQCLFPFEFACEENYYC